MPVEALQKLRAKYPQYADIPDQQLAQRIVSKYPEYSDLLGDVAAGGNAGPSGTPGSVLAGVASGAAAGGAKAAASATNGSSADSLLPGLMESVKAYNRRAYGGKTFGAEHAVQAGAEDLGITPQEAKTYGINPAVRRSLTPPPVGPAADLEASARSKEQVAGLMDSYGVPNAAALRRARIARTAATRAAAKQQSDYPGQSGPRAAQQRQRFGLEPAESLVGALYDTMGGPGVGYAAEHADPNEPGAAAWMMRNATGLSQPQTILQLAGLGGAIEAIPALGLPAALGFGAKQGYEGLDRVRAGDPVGGALDIAMGAAPFASSGARAHMSEPYVRAAERMNAPAAAREAAATARLQPNKLDAIADRIIASAQDEAALDPRSYASRLEQLSRANRPSKPGTVSVDDLAATGPRGVFERPSVQGVWQPGQEGLTPGTTPGVYMRRGPTLPDMSGEVPVTQTASIKGQKRAARTAPLVDVSGASGGAQATTEAPSGPDFSDKRAGHVYGSQDVTYTPSGNPVGVRYALVPMEELVASHTDTLAENPRYDQNLQPRDRAKTASREQVADQAARLIPGVLERAPYTSDGAPIIGPDNMVESGNVRLLSLRRAAQAHPAKYAAYVDHLRQNAASWGLDPSSVDDMLSNGQRPVLVRVRESFGGKAQLTPAERAAFAEEAGRPTVARMSEAEVARRDAAQLQQAGLLRPDANGRYPTPSSPEFRQGFMGTVPEAERAGMIQPDGELSNEGRRRMQNAVLASAFEDPSALSRALEDPNDTTKNIGRAVMDAAPKLANIRQEIGAGNLHRLDPTAEIAEAANTLASLRERGQNVGEWLATGDLTGQRSPVTDALMRIFERFKLSKNAIARVLDSYAEGVYAVGSPKESSLFGGVEPPTKLEVLEAAVRRAEGDAGRSLAEDTQGVNPAQGGETPRGAAAAPRGGAGAQDVAAPGGREGGAGTEGGRSAGPERAVRPAEQQPTLQPQQAQTSKSVGRPTEDSVSGSSSPRAYITNALEAASKAATAGERGEAMRGTAPDAIAKRFNLSPQQARSLLNEVMDAREQLARLEAKEKLAAKKKGGLSEAEKQQLNEAKRTLVKKLGRLNAGIPLDPETISAAAAILKLEAKRARLSLQDAAERLIAERPDLREHYTAALEGLSRAGGVAAAPNSPDAPTASNAPNTSSQGKRPSIFRDGRFRGSYSVDHPTGDKVNALAASGESAQLKATHAVRDVTKGLSEEQVDTLGRVLVGRRLRNVNPSHEQALTVKEENRLLQDKPVADAALRYVKVKREIEGLRSKAGLTQEQIEANPDPFFVSLLKEGQDADGKAILRNEAGESITPASPARPGGSLSSRTRSKSTVHARSATGTADRYVTDIADLIHEGYREALPKARMRELYDHLVKEGIAYVPKDGERPPSEITVHGKSYPARPVEVSRYGLKAEDGSLLRDVYVPDRIAADIHDVRYKPEPTEIGKVGRLWQGAATTTALTANPRELVNHSRRIMRVLSAIDPEDKHIGVRVAEGLVPYISPKVGAWARLISTDMSSAENMGVMQDIFDANAGSSRPFKHYEVSGKGPLDPRTYLGAVQRFGHDMLFSVPEGRGVKGLDIRVRVVAEKIRRAAEEGNTDPKRIREFANQFGQYTNHPDHFIEAVKRINPFAATNLALRVTELRQTLLGDSGLKGGSLSKKALRRATTLYRGVGGTALAYVFLNKMLSGKYPWQNAPGHVYEVNVGKDRDGRDVYVKPQVFDPVVARVINTFGLQQADAERGLVGVDKKGRDRRLKRDVPLDVATGLANQGLNVISSPGLNDVASTATGFAPYLARRPGEAAPGPLDVAGRAKPGETGPMRYRNVRGAVAAIRAAHPAGELLPGEDRKSQQMLDPRLKRLQYALWVLGGGIHKGASKTARGR